MKTLVDISLTDGDRTAVAQAAAEARRILPVSRVVLFGSKARGTDSADSDLDLLILTKRRTSHQERKLLIDALLDVELEMNVTISVLIVPESEWDHGAYRAMPIHHEVNRDGVAA